jgi:hypothetical protein
MDQGPDIQELLPAEGNRPADEADRQATERERITRQLVDHPKVLSTKHHRAVGCKVRGGAPLHAELFGLLHGDLDHSRLNVDLPSGDIQPFNHLH